MPLAALDIRVHSDDEVRALPTIRQPQPSDPYRFDHPVTQQGQGLNRRSQAGDRWCPFCQTPLAKSRQACDVCQPIRADNIKRGLTRRASTPEPVEAPVDDADLRALLEAVDEMARVIAVASAMQNRGGGLKPQQTEDMFFACKDVMVAADPIRRRLHEGD